MPTLGMHSLLGLFMSSQVKNKIMTVALVFGSLIPDVDLVVAVIAYFLPGGSIDAGKYIHRSWSHSLITIGFIFLIGIIIYKSTQEETSWNIYGVFFAFMAIGMIVHSLADVIYIGYFTAADAAALYNPGVALLWPLRMDRFALLPVQVNNMVYNFLITSDFWTDSLFVFFPVLYLAYRNNTNVSNRKPLLPIAVVDSFIFGTFTILSLLVSIPPEDMVFYVYLLGIFDIILVLLLSLLMRETIGNIYRPILKPAETK